MDTERREPPGPGAGYEGSEALGAWFLGPVGENEALLAEWVSRAVALHVTGRKEGYDDPPWITDRVTQTDAYARASRQLTERLDELCGRLNRSVPFFSYRYQGHMLWDITLPGALGSFAAMLYNQNNVAAEASPVTTNLELEVAAELCAMLGYGLSPRPWAHITCDGSVANMEALWAARNLKLFPHALAAALDGEPGLAAARGLTVPLANGRPKLVVELTPWELLNLKADDVLALPRRMMVEHGVDETAVASIKAYTVQHLGIARFREQHPQADLDRLVLLSPATSHYSLPKGASLLGLGESAVIPIRVDREARQDASHLEEVLDGCLAEQRPVAAVIAVLGTTEESAVDPLATILSLRDHYRLSGLDFLVHVDAAWGGYFASLLRLPGETTLAARILAMAGQLRYTSAAAMLARTSELLEALGEEDDPRQALVFTPELAMSPYVEDQYRSLPRADSITVDPHKAGFIPYPAGALCYRNGAMTQLVAFSAHVVHHSAAEPSVGIFGIEGSKPGAAAAAVWLSHRVIPPDQSGYGRILGRCLFNSKRFYAALLTMARPDDCFIVRTLALLPAEREGKSDKEIEDEFQRVAHFAAMTENVDLWEYLAEHPDDERLFRQLGSDQVIIAYAFNFTDSGGRLNMDPAQANCLNQLVFAEASVTKEPPPGPARRPPIIITHSKFDPKVYGRQFVAGFAARLGLDDPGDVPLDFLISTTMNPWLTDTSVRPSNMIPALIEGLRRTVIAAVEAVRGGATIEGGQSGDSCPEGYGHDVEPEDRY